MTFKSMNLLKLTKHSAIHSWSDFNGQRGSFEIGAVLL